MKTLLFIIGLSYSTVSYACGGRSNNLEDIVLSISAVLIALCAMILPLATMLVTKMIGMRAIINLAILFGFVSASLLAVLMSDLFREYRAGVIMLLACSMFSPTGYFCYKAIQQHVKTLR